MRFVVTLATRLAGDPLLSATLAHELGHTLGVFRHSPHAEDIMSAVITRPELTERDKATFRLLYHTRADLTP